MLLSSLLLSVLGWLLILWWVDRPSVPVWQAKYAYRLLAFCCWVGWALTAAKALQWHTELVLLIRSCP